MPQHSCGASARAWAIISPRMCWGMLRVRTRPCSRKMIDWKSTRLNSSHDQISYAVFCLKKKIRSVLFRSDRKSTRLNSSHDQISYVVICFCVEIFTFYVTHRYVYGEQWMKFMKDGVNATPLTTVNTTGYIDHAAFLGTIIPDTNKIPKHLFQGYLNIYNNYFKAPWMPDRTQANPNELNQDDARYGFRCCQLKNIWTAPLPPETELSRQMTTSTTSIDIMGLQAAYANLHTDQERDYFMQRYHDVISSFGGKTSYDADNRPLLVMRSNLWASGYDVDGTDQTSLGQFSGRVQQTYKHSVPRFFVPEHGTMFTLALVRFPPTATKEIQYLNAKGALTYTDIAGDPVLYGNLPPREISMKDVFRSGDSSKKFKIAEGQWYRYAPSYV